MRVAWLSQFPLWRLAGSPEAARRRLTHASSWIVNLSRALVSSYKDLDLHLITESTYVRRSLRWEEEGITFHVVRSGSTIPFIQRGFPAFLPVPALTCFHRNVAVLSRILEEVDPDIVHAHGTEGAYALTGIRSKYPCVVSLQAIMAYLALEKRSISMMVVSKLEKEVLKRGQYFIPKSAFARDFVLSQNSMAKIFHIEDCVDEKFFQIRPIAESRNILFVGSIIPEKGVEELIVAFSMIKRGRLRLVGDGNPRFVQSLKEKVKRLGIDSFVDWLGFMKHDHIVEEFENAGLLVLPSYMENTPNVVAEAMCAGLPVVASAVGGIPSMVFHEETGLLVEAKQPLLLAQAISQILDNSRLRASLGNNGRERALARFTLELAARKTWEAYQEILEDYRGRAS